MNKASSPFSGARRRRGVRLSVAIGSLVTASALLLSGCSSTGATASDTATSGSAAKAALTMMNNSRGSAQGLEALAAEYKKETGVTVTVDTPGPTDYLAKLQAAAQSGDMPDLYTAIAPSDLAPFIKAGWALNLQPTLDSGWSSDFTPSTIKLTTYAKGNSLGIPAGVYAAYWDTGVYGFFGDPSKAGYSAKTPPATMTDFIDGLSNKGGNNFSIAASLTPYLLQSYASNFMTDAQIDATLSGKASWQTDAWKKTFQLLVDLKKSGVISNSALPGGSSDAPDVEKSFFNSQNIAAMFDASWATAVQTTTAPDFTSYTTFVPPKAAGAKYKARAVVVPGKGALVNAKGKHTKEALAFLKWLTEPAQQKTFMKTTNGIPTSPKLLSSGAVSSGFAAGVSTGQVVTSPFTANVVSVIVADSQSLVLGEKTVDQVLSDVQAAQDKS